MDQKKKRDVEEKGDSRHPRRLKHIHAVLYRLIVGHNDPCSDSSLNEGKSQMRTEEIRNPLAVGWPWFFVELEGARCEIKCLLKPDQTSNHVCLFSSVI